MKITLDGIDTLIGSTDELWIFLDRIDGQARFELWISTEGGPSLAMLRNGEHGWLMYLRFNGDSGLVTKGDQGRQGTSAYKLSNGQVDEYPLSWCIDLGQCYEAIAHFFVNDGARYDALTWQAA